MGADPMELESTLYIVIQLVEIYDGGIEPGKARIYDSQHCSDKYVIDSSGDSYVFGVD